MYLLRYWARGDLCAVQSLTCLFFLKDAHFNMTLSYRLTSEGWRAIGGTVSFWLPVLLTSFFILQNCLTFFAWSSFLIERKTNTKKIKQSKELMSCSVTKFFLQFELRALSCLSDRDQYSVSSGESYKCLPLDFVESADSGKRLLHVQPSAMPIIEASSLRHGTSVNLCPIAQCESHWDLLPCGCRCAA